MNKKEYNKKWREAHKEQYKDYWKKRTERWNDDYKKRLENKNEPRIFTNIKEKHRKDFKIFGNYLNEMIITRGIVPWNIIKLIKKN